MSVSTALRDVRTRLVLTSGSLLFVELLLIRWIPAEVRYTGASVGYQLASIFAGALAPIIAIDLLGSASEGTANVHKVAIYMTIASVLTIVAVLFAKETRASSLRHDRVLPDAH